MPSALAEEGKKHESGSHRPDDKLNLCTAKKKNGPLQRDWWF